MLGYTIRRGKYISVKAPDQQRAVRLKTLGEDYTVENLASGILWKDVGSGRMPLGQLSELGERYSATIYNVEQLALTGRKVLRRRDTAAPHSPQNDMDVYKLSAQCELNKLLAQQDTLADLAEQAEEYFFAVG